MTLVKHNAVALACSFALLAASLDAGAADMPKRKSGLWEITTSAEGQTTPPMQMCIDEKVDDLSRDMTQGDVKCSKQDMRREGDRYVIDSVCKFGETTATSHIVVTGKLDSAYQMDIQSKYNPPMMGMSEGRSTMKARWLGACKAGQRPGDMVMPGGMTINVYDAAKSAPRR
jgi:hypothetical protein